MRALQVTIALTKERVTLLTALTSSCALKVIIVPREPSVLFSVRLVTTQDLRVLVPALTVMPVQLVTPVSAVLTYPTHLIPSMTQQTGLTSAQQVSTAQLDLPQSNSKNVQEATTVPLLQ